MVSYLYPPIHIVCRPLANIRQPFKYKSPDWCSRSHQYDPQIINEVINAQYSVPQPKYDKTTKWSTFSIAILNPLLCPHRRIAGELEKVLETSALGARLKPSVSDKLRCAAFRRLVSLNAVASMT